jgi:hypothetical protein
MFWKWIKRGLIATGGALLLGALVFGVDLMSYLKSGRNTMRSAVKDAVPTEFELQRAKDLVEDIIPEMQANVRLIATEEVEIAQLRQDIAQSGKNIVAEREQISRLTNLLADERAVYNVGGHDYPRQEVRQNLSRRFERFKEAEVVLSGKERLMTTREGSLRGATLMLERTRGQKALLEDKIAGLEAQHRLVQAAAVGSKLQVDGTKLAQAEKLITQIKKRLDVSERVLAHESAFTDPMPVDTTTDAEFVAEIREHLSGADEKPKAIAAAAPLPALPPVEATPAKGAVGGQ